MVKSSIAREKPLARRGDVGVTDVGENPSGAVGQVGDEACAELVGGAFEAEGDQRAGLTEVSDELG